MIFMDGNAPSFLRPQLRAMTFVRREDFKNGTWCGNRIPIEALEEPILSIKRTRHLLFNKTIIICLLFKNN
jgi:hypothetical protein